jgi:hypothetical protein
LAFLFALAGERKYILFVAIHIWIFIYLQILFRFFLYRFYLQFPLYPTIVFNFSSRVFKIASCSMEVGGGGANIVDINQNLLLAVNKTRTAYRISSISKEDVSEQELEIFNLRRRWSFKKKKSMDDNNSHTLLTVIR